MAHHTIQPLEIFSQLYIGDYFTDTLSFSAEAHAAFRLLLLHTWLHGATQPGEQAAIARASPDEWHELKPTVLPLLSTATASITKWKSALQPYDGARLPPEDWYVVRTIVLERDGYTCQYCGSPKRLHVDHKTPLARGGSNAFENLVTSCGPCNQSKGTKSLSEWKPPPFIGS